MTFPCFRALAFLMLERLFQGTVSSNIVAHLSSMTKKSDLVVVPIMRAWGGDGYRRGFTQTVVGHFHIDVGCWVETLQE